MDPVQFALMEDNRPQQRLADEDAQNQQGMQNVLQGAQIFQQGSIARQRLGQEKQLSMAQMSMQQSQFTALQQLREQEFAVNTQKSMADIAQAKAVTDMDMTQNQLIQDQAALVPKQHANQAYISNILAQPQAKDPATGSQWVMGQMRQAPFPEALTDMDRKDALATNDLGIQQSATGIAFKANLSQQLQTINEGASMGLPMQNYQIKQGSPGDPTTYDMQKLSADVMAKKVAMQTNLIHLKQQGEIDRAKILAGARTDTGRTMLSTLSQQAIQADKAVDALAKQFPPASASTIMQAKASAQAAHDRYNAAAKVSAAPDGSADDEGAGALGTPGQTAANATMQNPSGTPAPAANPAQNFWINNMGAGGH